MRRLFRFNQIEAICADTVSPFSGLIHFRNGFLIASVALALGACGNNGDSSSPNVAPGGPTAAVVPTTQPEASRFLAQSSMGANVSSIDYVSGNGYPRWLEQQMAIPAGSPHQSYLVSVIAGLPVGQGPQDSHVMNTFWKQSASAQGQLRQRIAFALSQIFVVSLQNDAVAEYRRGAASYLDMLGQQAFGNYRDLLEAVTLHPMMGLYLTHLRNRKESGNRIPDQNYAREVMQLFSIGLYQLNPDGTQIFSNGQPVETYTNTDIAGLSRVFTGFSWAGPDKQDGRFFGSTTPAPDPNRDVLPMQDYPIFHSTSAKTFLGVTIPAQNPADPRASLRIALDTIAAHPNVGPFFGRLLIQRLVTSNPSPAYVSRVSQAFDSGSFVWNNGWRIGSERRGDLRATIAAVLLDDEARDMRKISDPGFGKVREPVLRLSAWMRAFNARSASGNFLLGTTDDTASSLGQSAMRSPSVFNFYRAGYVPPTTPIAAANLIAPEFQIIHEISVVGYANFMRSAVQSGVGSNTPRDILPDYTAEMALANDADRLIDRIDLLLTYGTLSTETRSAIQDAVNSVPISAANPAQGRQNRVYLATLFALSSPEFLVQK
ncbi:MAG: DUF1800 domain-containing protein [Burkholderiales bacterium]